jgi:hypothetical protein
MHRPTASAADLVVSPPPPPSLQCPDPVICAPLDLPVFVHTSLSLSLCAAVREDEGPRLVDIGVDIDGDAACVEHGLDFVNQLAHQRDVGGRQAVAQSCMCLHVHVYVYVCMRACVCI